MRAFTRTILSASLLLLPIHLGGQTPADPSGHWEGSVEAQGMDMRFEVDLARNSQGELTGILGVPAEKLRGLPLLKVVQIGRAVNFYARSDQTFAGDLEGDGKAMSGTFTIEGAALPFMLRRTGDARIEPPPESPAISKELEGTWSGTVKGPNASIHFMLTMENGADGMATGRLVNLDEGGLQIPVVITSSGTELTIVPTVGTGMLRVSLSATGTELVGAWKEGAVSVPLTIQRAAASDKK